MDKEALHREMKRLRYDENLPLREVAERTKMSMATVSYWTDDEARERKLAEFRNARPDLGRGKCI